MRLYPSIPAAILLVTLPACSVSKQPQMSPSGRYSVCYFKADYGQDVFDAPYYSVTDERYHQRSFTICTENDTKLADDSIAWSPTEMTFVIRQSDLGLNRRFVLAAWNQQGRHFNYHVIRMCPLEARYFSECHASIVSVSDASVVFDAGHSHGTKALSIRELIKESQRQEDE